MKECPFCNRCYPDQIRHCPRDGKPLVSSLQGEPLLDGRYHLEQRLGQGGMGIVYKARHNLLRTAFAIKVILPDLIGNDPMLVHRFRQEAMAAALIRHPNIITVTDFGVVGEKMPFLVMEFIKGKSLHETLAREGRLSPRRSLEILDAVAAGVGAAHRQGIVHRDLKPLNIMIQDDTPISHAVKVLDFGLAKIKSGELLGSFVAAQTTGLMGSPLYMAPELWSDEEPDRRADIYSLGVILYQMLTGDVPFKGTSAPSIMKKILTSEPPPFSSFGVDVPPEVEAVVRHALEKDQGKRPQTVEELIDELHRAIFSQAPEQTAPSISRRGATDGRLADTVRALPAIEFTSGPSQETAETRRRIEGEADRFAREAELAQLRAEEARKRAEEADRLACEIEEARRRAEEAHQLAAEEAQKRAAEEAARRRAEEAARQWAEEADRLAQEVKEAQRRAEEAHKLAEEAANKRVEEEARKRAEEADRLACEIEEARRRAEEAHQLAAEEAQKRAAEEAARRRAEEKAQRLAQEEAEKHALEEVARRRAQEEAVRLAREIEEARRRAEEALQLAEEEARKRATEEEARKHAEAEARKLAEEGARRHSEDRPQAETPSQPSDTSVTVPTVTQGRVTLPITSGDTLLSVGAQTITPDAARPIWRRRSVAIAIGMTLVVVLGVTYALRRITGGEAKNKTPSLVSETVINPPVVSPPLFVSGTPRGVLMAQHELYEVALSADGQLLASTGDENKVRLWRVNDLSLVRELQGYRPPGRSVALSRDEHIVASGSDDGVIWLWRTSDGTLLRRLRGHTDYVFLVGFSADGQTLVSASGDKTVRFWQVEDGKLLRTLNLPNQDERIINISPDQSLVALYDEKTKGVRIWSLAENTVLRALQGHSYKLVFGAFSPNAQFLALGSTDGSVRLWRVSDGSLTATFTGPAMDEGSAAFSPNGQVIAAGWKDGTVRLWQVSDGSLLKRLVGHTKTVQSLAFSANGRILASGSDDRTIRLWQIIE
jgi:serine/threonine-protein kinase